MPPLNLVFENPSDWIHGTVEEPAVGERPDVGDAP